MTKQPRIIAKQPRGMPLALYHVLLKFLAYTLYHWATRGTGRSTVSTARSFNDKYWMIQHFYFPLAKSNRTRLVQLVVRLELYQLLLYALFLLYYLWLDIVGLDIDIISGTRSLKYVGKMRVGKLRCRQSKNKSQTLLVLNHFNFMHQSGQKNWRGDFVHTVHSAIWCLRHLAAAC